MAEMSRAQRVLLLMGWMTYVGLIAAPVATIVFAGISVPALVAIAHGMERLEEIRRVLPWIIVVLAAVVAVTMPIIAKERSRIGFLAGAVGMGVIFSILKRTG